MRRRCRCRPHPVNNHGARCFAPRPSTTSNECCHRFEFIFRHNQPQLLGRPITHIRQHTEPNDHYVAANRLDALLLT